MSDSSRQRSKDFLKIADQFKLGELTTEAFHTVTRDLSDVASQDTAAALKLLFQVDGEVVEKYREVAASGRLEAIAEDVHKALQDGGRVFFTGCGSTGRLSILLDSIWRDFWQGQGTGDWEDRTFSVMAGGDFALIKAVEGFEDYTVFGRKQIRDLGVSNKDVVFAITEGGETSFVIGTAWEGVDAGAKVHFVYNNPDDVLREHVKRSREVIEDERIEKLNLTTGPMAISGSTRMQATTIQLCVMLTVLEMTIQRLLGRDESDWKNLQTTFLEGLENLLRMLQDDRILKSLASVVELETAAYQAGAKAHYHADRFAIDVLTDTTERSPTFCTPPFRKQGDRNSSESMVFLFVPGRNTPEAWKWVLKRAPRCLSWTRADVESLVPPENLDRVTEILGTIKEEELMKFAIGSDGFEDRPVRPGDFVLNIASGQEAWPSHSENETANQRWLRFETGPASRSEQTDADTVIPIPATGMLLDGLTRAAVKMVLNAISTCVMVKLGRVMGNTMIYVVPSNLKLIDRATRYIRRLLQQDYNESNELLFEAIEYVEPRMLAGKEYPPVVGLSVLRIRDGLTFEDGEARLKSGFKPSP